MRYNRVEIISYECNCGGTMPIEVNGVLIGVESNSCSYCDKKTKQRSRLTNN